MIQNPAPLSRTPASWMSKHASSPFLSPTFSGFSRDMSETEKETTFQNGSAYLGSMHFHGNDLSRNLLGLDRGLGVGKRSSWPSERATRCGGQGRHSDSHLLATPRRPCPGRAPFSGLGFALCLLHAVGPALSQGPYDMVAGVTWR